MNWSTQYHCRRTVDLLMISLPAFWFPDILLKALCSVFLSSALCPLIFLFFSQKNLTCFSLKTGNTFYLFPNEVFFSVSLSVSSSLPVFAPFLGFAFLYFLLLSVPFLPLIFLSSYLSFLLHFPHCLSSDLLFFPFSLRSTFSSFASKRFLYLCLYMQIQIKAESGCLWRWRHLAFERWC